MAAVSETVHLGKDNTIDLELRANGQPVEEFRPGYMATITRMELVYLDQTINSADNPEAFDWITRQSESVVVLALGHLSLALGHDLAADLIVYDPANPNGLHWSTFTLTVAS